MQIDPILGFAALESTILSPPRGQWSLFFFSKAEKFSKKEKFSFLPLRVKETAAFKNKCWGSAFSGKKKKKLGFRFWVFSCSENPDCWAVDVRAALHLNLLLLTMETLGFWDVGNEIISDCWRSFWLLLSFWNVTGNDLRGLLQP